MEINETALLLGVFTLYFFLAFVLPTVRVWYQTGKNPYVLPISDDAYGFVSRCMKLLIGGLFVYFTAKLFWTGMGKFIGALPGSGFRSVQSIGWSLLVVAILLTLTAQYQMGKSWWIGIDTHEKTDLVTNGLFAWSRNPIFLAMRVCLLALLLIQPNAVTLTFFCGGELVMQFQVRLEEAFLYDQHGERYTNYCATVGRWL
ncbi:MAG: isoprenylcysteine carboxylmethyltransferase family protein [Pseudomonadota bacterium]